MVCARSLSQPLTAIASCSRKSWRAKFVQKSRLPQLRFRSKNRGVLRDAVKKGKHTVSLALNRLILYARDVEGTVAFYEKHFGFKVLRLPGDRIVELVAQGGGR